MPKDKVLEWEKNWWGTCQNTFGEETKQFYYAKKMGLELCNTHQSPYNINVRSARIIDIGGGPVSLLLKCLNLKRGMVIDPIKFPAWIYKRYELAGIEYRILDGEGITATLVPDAWDEAWIYNVLQHVKDPKKVIRNTRHISNLIRIFEWVDMASTNTHPHMLSAESLNEWLGGEGKREVITTPWDNKPAICYYGVFPT